MKATPENAALLHVRGLADRDAYSRALEIMRPTPANWQSFLRRALLLIAVVLFVAGVIFFFAFNWKDLPRLARLGLVQALFAMFIAGFFFSRGVVRGAAATGASLTVGAIFAVFGQIYQTGADSYLLFEMWAICAFFIAVFSRFSGSWLIWLIVTNLAVYFYFEQMFAFGHDLPRWLSHSAICAIAWIWFEFQHMRKLEISPHPWLADTAMLGMIAISSLGATMRVFDSGTDPDASHTIPVFLFLSAVAFTASFFYLKRLFGIAVVLGGWILFLTSAMAKNHNTSADFLALAFFVIVQTTLAILFLRYAARRLQS